MRPTALRTAAGTRFDGNW